MDPAASDQRRSRLTNRVCQEEINEHGRTFPRGGSLESSLGKQFIRVHSKFASELQVTRKPLSKLHVVDFWMELHTHIPAYGEGLYGSP
jgi:hypothetical protein